MKSAGHLSAYISKNLLDSGPKGRPWYKIISIGPLSCACTEAGFPPGIHIPTGFDDAGASVDGRVFVARCDACAIFSSDFDAAKFLSVVIGLPFYKLFDNEVDSYYRCYFNITLEQALALKIHVSPIPQETCLECLAKEVA